MRLAERPEDLPAVFAERFNSGDPAAVAELYESGAVFVPEPGVPLTGAPARAANSRFQALGLPIEVRPRHVYVAGDVALLLVDWTIGDEVAGTATDVARRGADGCWRYAVDNPFGTAG
ncbi:YybH family protein [Saccharothrix coeruleofusca]|uniref:SnoaL-like domain-containing protein n=1 Tax=Saccharothrix coeruleofusca TaxID=33919 RepID=A0A918AP37_9PSEU|nr:nuclear transport factor 2 family protein [Saccharothrix coeruleofusca]MBP2338016.1 ketosteroid isomerase-like protein [Saccharothrix coeruleofusca]GGP63781.1 hypothetical protein GCM10010185_40610 [Saccharothrix coeruleofusca]